jgi:hypothetical protein
MGFVGRVGFSGSPFFLPLAGITEGAATIGGTSSAAVE